MNLAFSREFIITSRPISSIQGLIFKLSLLASHMLADLLHSIKSVLGLVISSIFNFKKLFEKAVKQMKTRTNPSYSSTQPESVTVAVESYIQGSERWNSRIQAKLVLRKI